MHLNGIRGEMCLQMYNKSWSAPLSGIGQTAMGMSENARKTTQFTRTKIEVSVLIDAIQFSLAFVFSPLLNAFV